MRFRPPRWVEPQSSAHGVSKLVRRARQKHGSGDSLVAGQNVGNESLFYVPYGKAGGKERNMRDSFKILYLKLKLFQMVVMGFWFDMPQRRLRKRS